MSLRVTLFGNSDIVNAREAFVEELKAFDVDAHFAFLESNAPGALRDATNELRRAADAGEVDLVHSFDTGPNVIAGLAMAKVATPHMATITGRGQLYSGALAAATPVHKVYEATFRRALRSSSRIVCQNSRDADYFGDLAIGPPVMTVIGSGVDVDRYQVPTPQEQAAARAMLDIDEGAIVVSLPTRMLKSKGIPQLLEAAERLHRTHPGRYVFVLAGGDGPAWNPRNADMSEVPKTGPTRFLGSVSDMAGLYSATDILVLPTAYAEGLPRVLLEAAGAGCQLLSTSAPGCEDVIDSDLVGHVMSIPATPEAIVAGVLDRSKDLGTADRHTRRQAFLDKQLDLTSVAKRYAAIYHAIA